MTVKLFFQAIHIIKFCAMFLFYFCLWCEPKKIIFVSHIFFCVSRLASSRLRVLCISGISNTYLATYMTASFIYLEYIWIYLHNISGFHIVSVRPWLGMIRISWGKSPEWFGRRPRLTKGHYRCTANLCYRWNSRYDTSQSVGWTQPFIPHDQQSLV